MKRSVPVEFKPFLWSYDISKMDLEKDKERIILNVLNLGTKKATDKLQDVYSKDDIKKVFNKKSYELNKKSLNYWSMKYGIDSAIKSRF